MPSVVLSHLGYSLYGKTIFTEILDKTVDDVFPYTETTIYKAETHYIEEGVNNDIFNNIVTSRYTISMKLDANTKFLYDNLTDDEAEEGRYYVRVKQNGVVIFIGKIMLEAMSREDKREPAFSFTAIDALTDLKNIPFDYDGERPSAPYIRHIFAYIFRQLPTDWILDDNTIRYSFSSELVPNTTFYTDNILENMFVGRYFYELKNNVAIDLNCWDVLVELLSRLNLHCRYQIGSFWLTDLTTIHNEYTQPVHYYDKDGEIIASDPAWFSTFENFNLNNKCRVGGKYYHESGFKTVRIEGDRRFSNKKQGDGRIVLLGLPTPFDGLYNYVGEIESTKSYKLRVKVKVTETNAPSGANFTVRLSLRTTIGVTTTVIMTDKQFIFPLTTSEYIITEDIASNASDRTLESRYKIYGASGNTAKITFEAFLSEDLIEKDAVVIQSSLNDTRLTAIKERTVLATDSYGTELTRFNFWDGDPFVTKETTRQWKLAGEASWRTIEKIIVEHQVKYMSKTEMLNVTHQNSDGWVIPFFNGISYDDIIYYIAGRKDNLYNDTTEYNLIRKNAAKTNTLTTEESVPTSDVTNGNISSITGNVLLTAKQPTRIYERNLNGNSYVIDYDFNPDATWESVEKSVIVYINGFKQYLKNSASLSAAHQTEIYLNLSTNTLSFPITYVKAKIEIYITDYFVIGVVA